MADLPMLETCTVAGPACEVDEYGFLKDPELWNEDVAQELARREALGPLTEEHWKLIRYTRHYYLKYGAAPMIRKLAQETGVTVKRIREMFPSGSMEAVMKLAGLPVPKPTACMGSCLTCGAYGTRLCQPAPEKSSRRENGDGI